MFALAGIGGAIFSACEYQREERLLADYWELDNLIDATFPNDADNRLVREYTSFSGLIDRNKWIFRYAVFFACTTMTTIGFGFQAPKTLNGRILSMVYGVPSIIIFSFLASEVGKILLNYLDIIFRQNLLKWSHEKWKEYRFIVYTILFGMVFMLLSFIIKITATEEGFGRGIDNYGKAIYFLWQTTTTIGYGDLMMSGSNTLVSMFFGLWLASVLGMAIALLSFVDKNLEAVTGNVRKNTLVSKKSLKANQKLHRNVINAHLQKNNGDEPAIEIEEIEEEGYIEEKK